VNLAGTLRGGDNGGINRLLAGQDPQAIALTPAAREKLAKDKSANADEIKAVTEPLKEFDLFGREEIKDVRTAPEFTHFSKVADSWYLLQQAQELALKMGTSFKPLGNHKAGTGKPNPAKTVLEKSTSELSAVETALKDEALKSLFESVPGAKAIETHLEERKAALKDQSDLDSKIGAIRKAFSNKDWKICRDKIASITVADLSPDLAGELQEIKRHADFKFHWLNPPNFTSTVSNLAKLQKDVATLEDLIQRSPMATNDEEEAELKAQNLRLAAGKSSVLVNQLFARPPQDLRDLVERCEQLAKEDPNSSRQIGSSLKGYLRTKLREKNGSPLPANIKEVRIVKENKYERGFFQAVGGADPEFHYWPSKKESEIDPDAYKVKTLKQFQGPPGPACDVLIATSYNQMYQELVRLQLDDKQKWATFESSCTEWQKQLDEYYLQWPVQMKVGFQNELQLAHDVIELWPTISPFLAK
jgi:hypothetical protein